MCISKCKKTKHKKTMNDRRNHHCYRSISEGLQSNRLCLCLVVFVNDTCLIDYMIAGALLTITAGYLKVGENVTVEKFKFVFDAIQSALFVFHLLRKDVLLECY